MSTFIPREEAFTCEHCGGTVEPLGRGTYRDHCPKCLWGKHVDLHGPGDRLSKCKGLLMPVAVDLNGKKGYVVEYECLSCGMQSRNKAAPDDDVVGFLAQMSQIEQEM
jgi:hypothetical protein